MSISVREEKPEDAAAVSSLIRRTYQRVPFSNHREHLMVGRLRVSPAFVPQLSLVAEAADEIVGHILLTKILIREGEKSRPSLALAPLSVSPDFQKQGIGRALIEAAHQRARELSFRSVIVVGIEGYYSKFGYVPLASYPSRVPFKVRAENCAIVELCAGEISRLSGDIEYAPEWIETPC